MPNQPLADAEMVALHVLGKTGEDLTASTLRSWVKRGHVSRHRGGRYSLAEVDDWLTRRNDRMIRRPSQTTGHTDVDTAGT